ncbi:MAG: hypothetical protein Q8P52_00125 [bacterium]|nr:hypothetical protein [bacterium]
MKISNGMNKSASIILTVALLITLGIIFIGDSESRGNTNTATNEAVQNSVIKDGVQYVTVSAKGGYSPRVSMAQADIPTKLIIKTDGTFDCSLSLVIRSIGYQKILPQTGETKIDIGSQKAGDVLQGVCSMGMFSFQIRFN